MLAVYVYVSLTAILSYLQVLIPLLSNSGNHTRWPQVVSQDVMHHVGVLKGDVYVLSGQVKGKTLLPLPAQTESVIRAAINQQQ